MPKVAFTGSSSTGKSAIANKLINDLRSSKVFTDGLIAVDSRSLIRSSGHKSMDIMSVQETRKFQLSYIEKKEASEKGATSYIVERSYTDVAAYWVVRDSLGMEKSERHVLIERCRNLCKNYDLHIYCPFGLLPFKSDGYRSESLEFHHMVDKQIKSFLNEWGLNFLTLSDVDLTKRAEMSINAIENLLSDF